MHGIQFHSKSVRNHFINLVPGHAFRRHDVHRLPQCMRIAQQADESRCEITVVGHGPQGGPVAMDDNRLTFQHSFKHLPAAIFSMHAERHGTFVKGMAWPYDSDGEAFLSVKLHQIILPLCLIP